MNNKGHRLLMTLGVLVLSATLVTGCYPPDLTGGGATTPTSSLENTDWQLVDIAGAPAVVGSEATLTFAGGGLTGTTGCNRYNGTYELVAGGLKLNPGAMTMMACAQPVMEQAFVAALTGTASYVLTADTLTLQDASGATLATFRPRQSAALTGTTWLATGINNGNQAVVSVVAGSQVTAVFGTDGNLSGNAGCNQYSAAYTVEGAELTIQSPISTLMACADEAVMQQEQAFLRALMQVTTFDIDGSNLVLRSADGATQVNLTAQP